MLLLRPMISYLKLKSMRRHLPFTILLITLARSADAQGPDSNYVQHISGYLNLRFTQSTELDRLTVTSGSSKIDLRPNASSVSKISLNYKFISIGFGFIPRFLPGNKDDRIKGKTSGKNFDLNFSFRHWVQSFNYHRTKGFYLDNTSDYQSGWSSGDPYLQFPDLYFTQYSGSTAYSFNSNFSVSAITAQTEKQLKTAGSFIPHLFYRFYQSDDRSPIPETGSFSRQRSNNGEILLGAGYFQNIVLPQQFCFTWGLVPGGGLVLTSFTTRSNEETITTRQTNGILRLDGRAGIGYNGSRWFAGLYGKISSSSLKQQRTTVINSETRLFFQLFAGYRLTAPKILRETVSKMESLIRH